MLFRSNGSIRKFQKTGRCRSTARAARTARNRCPPNFGRANAERAVHQTHSWDVAPVPMGSCSNPGHGSAEAGWIIQTGSTRGGRSRAIEGGEPAKRTVSRHPTRRPSLEKGATLPAAPRAAARSRTAPVEGECGRVRVTQSSGRIWKRPRGQIGRAHV